MLGSLKWTKCSSFMKRSLVKFAVTGHIFSPRVRKLNMSDLFVFPQNLGSGGHWDDNTTNMEIIIYPVSRQHFLSKYVFTLPCLDIQQTHSASWCGQNCQKCGHEDFPVWKHKTRVMRIIPKIIQVINQNSSYIISELFLWWGKYKVQYFCAEKGVLRKKRFVPTKLCWEAFKVHFQSMKKSKWLIWKLWLLS